jgi:protein-tyrosine phosphatase
LIDLHCHYLPGVDDGARDLDAGLALASAAVQDGVRIAVLTPHIFAGRWSNTLSSLKPRFDAFVQSMAQASIPLDVRLGAEVRLVHQSLTQYEAGEIPILGRWNGLDVLLLEFPDAVIPVGAMKAVEFLMRRGALPMIAHPERNRDVMRDPDRMRPFVETGCLLQLTAASVCGRFGRPAHDTSLALLDRGWVAAVATDAHNIAHRPPILGHARKVLCERYGAELACRLTETLPAAIVSGRSPEA